MARFNLTATIPLGMEIQAVLRILRLTATDRTIFAFVQPLKSLFFCIRSQGFSVFIPWENSAQSLNLQLWIHIGGERHKQRKI